MLATRTSSPTLDEANKSFRDVTNRTTVLEFICLDVLDDPLGELGIFKVLTDEGVTSLYDAMMILFAEVKTMPYTRASRDANGDEIPTGGANLMMKKKFKAFLSCYKFGCKFYNNFSIKSITRKHYNEFRTSSYFDPADTSLNDAVMHGIEETVTAAASNMPATPATNTRQATTPSTTGRGRVSSMGGTVTSTRSAAEQFSKSIKKDMKDFEEFKHEKD